MACPSLYVCELELEKLFLKFDFSMLKFNVTEALYQLAGMFRTGMMQRNQVLNFFLRNRFLHLLRTCHVLVMNRRRDSEADNWQTKRLTKNLFSIKMVRFAVAATVDLDVSLEKHLKNNGIQTNFIRVNFING